MSPHDPAYPKCSGRGKISPHRFGQSLQTLAERNKFATKAVGIRGRSRPTLQHASLALLQGTIALQLQAVSLSTGKKYETYCARPIAPVAASSGPLKKNCWTKRNLSSRPGVDSP